MNAVILSGSPRINGNTMKIVNEFIKGLKSENCDVHFIDTCKVNVKPCTGCLCCEKNGECVIKDDMQYIYKTVLGSDIVILASPVYFASLSAQLKTVIDRFQALFSKRYILKNDMGREKKGYVIFTAGGKNERMIESIELLSKFFFLSCNAKLQKSIYSMNLDKDSINETILHSAYILGQKAAREI